MLGLFVNNPEPGLLVRISDLTVNEVSGVDYPDKQNVPNTTVKPLECTRSLNGTVNPVKSRIHQVRLYTVSRHWDTAGQSFPEFEKRAPVNFSQVYYTRIEKNVIFG